MDADSPIMGADLIKLMENSLAVLGKPDADAYLSEFSDLYGNADRVQRYQLAQLLYGLRKS